MDFPGHVDEPVSLNTLHLRRQKRDFGSVVQIGLFSATVRARRGKNRPFGQGLAPAPAVQVKPRFETAGFRVFQNFREFPRVVLRKVQRRYGLRSSTSWHSSLSVRLFEGHGIFGGRWTSRLWHGRNAWSIRSTSGDALDLTRCEDRRRHCHCRRLGIQAAPPCHCLGDDRNAGTQLRRAQDCR